MFLKVGNNVESPKYCVLVLKVIAIYLTPRCLGWDVTSPSEGNNECGQIFFQSSFKGQSFILKDNEQISNLMEIESYDRKTKHVTHTPSSSNVNSNTNTTNTTTTVAAYSFRVQDGCKLRVSSLPYLKANVHEFLGDVEEIPEDWFVPKSLACECSKECRCEDIKLRKSECGRAYIKDNCTNCRATFTPLKASHGIATWNTFSENWSSHVTTILLRKGCNATLQFSRHSERSNSPPPSFAFTSSPVTPILPASGSLAKYICQCDDSDSMISEDTTSEENYPPLVTVPRTKGTINMLLAGRNELKNHPGLIAALQSLRSRKSSKNAYILLLGMSGSGKSTAVNLLFDHPNITKVGDYVSTTKDILQFSIPVPIAPLGINNTVLHVIDTPGIGDTDGIAEDARFLASLDTFLNSNTDLRRNLPNVVLIFSKFSDNRFSGEGSAFVRMLRTLDLFKERLIDKRSTNVIFVLTHYMSETKEITRDPSKRVAAIRRVIQEYSTLPRPVHIVLAENKPEEYGLLNVNGFYQLQNGEYYPKNLFDKMQRNLIGSNDLIGEAVIRTAFSNSDNFQIQGKRYPLLALTDEKVTNYLGILGAFHQPVTDTEVSIKLQEAYNNADSDLRTRYPNELLILQRKLNSRNIISVNDLPKTATDVIKLMEQIQINPLTLFLFENAFNLTVPDFPTSVLVGMGYSLSQDRVLHTPIFKNYNKSRVETKDFLFKVPELCKITLDHGIDNQFQVFTNQDDLFSARIKSLGLSEQAYRWTIGKGQLKSRWGYNLISFQDEDWLNDSTPPLTWDSLTATVSYHTFQITLNDSPELSEEFIKSVRDLKPLNLSLSENVESWQNFFKMYGTHVFTNAFAGGSIRIKVQLDENHHLEGTRMKNGEKFVLLSETLANITQQLGSELIGKDGIFAPRDGVKYQFSQIGGNHKHFWVNFSDFDEVKNADAWRESLKYEPTVLTNRVQVLPMSKVMRDFGKWEKEMDQVVNMVEEASASLLNASLVFIPVEKVRHNGNPESREKTLTEENDYQQMQEFSMMFHMISEASQEAQATLLKMMVESKEKKAIQEQQWEERIQLAREEQQRKARQLEEEARYDKELQMKRDRLEMERFAQEQLLEEEKQQSQRQMEMQQFLMMEEQRSKNEMNMLNFINQENARRDAIMRNKKKWHHRVGDFFKGGPIGLALGYL